MDSCVKRLLTIFPRILDINHQSRCYSVYVKNLKHPLTDANEIEKTVKDSDEVDFPLRAATSSTIFSVFHDPDVENFSSFIMRKGDRAFAEKLIRDTFYIVKSIQLKKFYDAPPKEREHIDLDPVSIFKKAVSNCRPVLATRKLKRSGVWYNIPCTVSENYATFLAMKFLVQAAKEKSKNVRLVTTLAHELINASENDGKAIQIKTDLHKYCESNRAYAHFRWT